MTTSEHWVKAIRDACGVREPSRSNQMITRVHYQLSEALADRLGRTGGPNFHTWAVWGSRKAGVTIRQEDLDSAIRNATVTAGIVGGIVGAATGVLAGRFLRVAANSANAVLGSGLGIIVGGWTGRRIAIWSREQAAKLVLDGNQTVLADIGEQSKTVPQARTAGFSLQGFDQDRVRITVRTVLRPRFAPILMPSTPVICLPSGKQ
jgi:hypothetical protein